MASPPVVESEACLSLTFGLPRSVLGRPGRWLVGLVFITAILAAALPWLELRTDGSVLYPSSDETVQRTRADRGRFRETDSCLLLLRSVEGGPDVATPAGLRLLRELHGEVGELEGVWRERVRSLATVIRPIEGQLLVFAPNYLDDIPDHQAGVDELVRGARGEPLTDGLFLSPDGRAAAISVATLPGEDRVALVSRIENWLETRELGEYELQLTGPVTVEVLLGRAVLSDLLQLVPVLILVIAVLLAICLRSVGGVLVTLAEVGAVLLWTFGAMSWTGTPVTLITAVLPIVLLTVAIADEMHLVGRVSTYLGAGLAREVAICSGLRDVARPIVLTSLTTAVGFLSFLTTKVAPLQHFGIFAAFGVIVAMGMSFSLVPALILILPERWFRVATPTAALRPAWYERFILGAGGRVGLLTLSVLFILPGLSRLRVADSWVDNLPPDSPAVSAEREFNRQFWGSYRYDIVLEHAELGFFQQGRGLRVMETLREALRGAPGVGGTVSHLVAYEIHADSDHEVGPVSGLDPETLLRFSGNLQKISRRIDLDQFLTGDGRAARLRMYVRNANFEGTRELETFVGDRLRELEGESLSSHVSGELAASQATVRSIVHNMLSSIAWTVLGVGLVILCYYREGRRALIVLTPLCMSLVVVSAFMGFAGWPLGIASSMFGAAAIGIGVDFGLHFVHAYECERESHVDHASALRGAFVRCGRPLRWNALVLSLGMLVLAGSSMKPNRELGVLLAAAIIVSYLATLLLMPTLVRRIDRKTCRDPSGSTPESPASASSTSQG